MLCSWPSLPRRFRSDHPGTWKLWQRSMHRVAASRLLMILWKWWYGITWYNMIWNDMVWYDIIWFDIIWYDIKWNYVICYGGIWYVIANHVYIQFVWSTKWIVSNLQMSCLCAWFEGIISMVQSVHVTSWKYSFPAHSTTHLIGKYMCKYSSKKQYQTINHVGVLKTWLARNNLHKLRTRPCQLTQNCVFSFNDVDSVVLMLYIVALFQPHSLWCFFSCWGVTNNMRAHRNAIPAWKNMPMMAIIASLSVSDFGIKLFGFLSRGQKRSTPWIQSLQHTQHFLGSVPGRPRRKPCRPRSDPILQGWHIGPLNNPHKSAKQHVILS